MDRQRPLAYRRVQDRYLSIVLDKIKEKKKKERIEMEKKAKRRILISINYPEQYVAFPRTRHKEY